MGPSRVTYYPDIGPRSLPHMSLRIFSKIWAVLLYENHHFGPKLLYHGPILAKIYPCGEVKIAVHLVFAPKKNFGPPNFYSTADRVQGRASHRTYRIRYVTKYVNTDSISATYGDKKIPRGRHGTVRDTYGRNT
jgi:hypothetical protein